MTTCSTVTSAIWAICGHRLDELLRRESCRFCNSTDRWTTIPVPQSCRRSTAPTPSEGRQRSRSERVSAWAARRRRREAAARPRGRWDAVEIAWLRGVASDSHSSTVPFQPEILLLSQTMTSANTGSHFAKLLDHLPEVLAWVKDRQGRYVWVNRAFVIQYWLDHQPGARARVRREFPRQDGL